MDKTVVENKETGKKEITTYRKFSIPMHLINVELLNADGSILTPEDKDGYACKSRFIVNLDGFPSYLITKITFPTLSFEGDNYNNCANCIIYLAPYREDVDAETYNTIAKETAEKWSKYETFA